MLSYKEYKLLNESLYGAFNLGLRSANTVGGIISGSSVNGTEAALEAGAEEAIEEGKKAKKMKKKMDGDEVESDEDDEEIKDKKPSDDEEGDEDDSDEDEDDEDSEDEGDSDEEDSDDKDEVEDKKKEFAFMKKKSKKEWSDVMSDLEEVLEVIEDEEALVEVKKGLEMMKKGMEKGCGKMMGKKCGKYMNEAKKHHKSDCDCPICEKKKDHDEDDKDGKDGEGLTAAQKKLPKALQDAILSKKDKGEKKGDKPVKEDDSAWWKSVNSMLGSNDQKNWDGGWSEVGEVKQAVRENPEG